MKKTTILVLSLLFLFSCATVTDGSINIPLPRFDLENDMFLPHEGLPAGVPDFYGWKSVPTLGYGANMPEGWGAIIAWGQVYADQNEPTPDRDFPLVRVHIKDLQLYIYQHDGTWKIIQDEQNPNGALYTEDFVENINKPAKIRREKGGGISVKAGSGYNFHFYPKDRTAISGDEIAGVFVACKARLIGTENYATLPKYLISIGGDYWRNMTVTWKSDFSNNSDIALGRFKYVTKDWQYFTMHTFSKDEVKNIIFPLESI